MIVLWLFAWLLNGTPPVEWFNGWFWGFAACWAVNELYSWYHAGQHAALDRG